jgi:hypothetical protein
MTIIKDFCGTAEAVPFPNELHSEFFSSLLKPNIFATSIGTAPSTSLRTGSAVPYPKTDF